MLDLANTRGTMQVNKGLKGRADRLFSLAIRSHGRCENCNKSSGVQLQCAHIMSRRYSKTRCDTRNGFCLCAGCHIYYTANPIAFTDFVRSTWAGEYFEEIQANAYDTLKKADWQERIDFLQPIVDGTISIVEARKLEK